ncbi:hypothetical protein Agub_g6578, partial [Astrephomene gubernaculifera]
MAAIHFAQPQLGIRTCPLKVATRSSLTCIARTPARLDRKERVGVAPQPGFAAMMPRVGPAAPKLQVKAASFLRRESSPPLDPESPEQVALRASAGWQCGLSFVAFWVQLALSVVAAGVLLFSLATTANSANQALSAAWPRYLTAAGTALSLTSAFFAHGFLRLGRQLRAGGGVAAGWLAGSLLRCNAVNVAGIAVTVVGLQASVGTLVARSLVSSVQAPFAVAPPSALVSLDVFALQAATNTLLAHVVSLLFTNLMMRLLGSAGAAAG